MKKITIVLILAALLLTSFSTAYAAGGPGGKGPGESSGQGQGGNSDQGQGGSYGQGEGGYYGQGLGAEEGENIRNRHQRVLFTLVGEITSVDNGVVTINVLAGNRLVKTYVGMDLAIVTTDTTRFLEKMEVSCVAITLAELEAGQSVSVQGTFTEGEDGADGVWTATRITVGALTLRK
jgi:hypothetical protein